MALSRCGQGDKTNNKGKYCCFHGLLIFGRVKKIVSPVLLLSYRLLDINNSAKTVMPLILEKLRMMR